MKILAVFAAWLLLSTAGFAQTIRLKTEAHPRLLWLENQEGGVLKNITHDKLLQNVQQNVFQSCNKWMDLPPVQNIKIGRRLLDKSRECLRRVFALSYAYRATHEKKYLDRAEKELLAVCSFKSWNPTHFLDVAEMTTAVAIGYDWLYNDLSPASRSIIKNAILKNGLEPSFNNKYNSWLRATNNWNQVCNAGMVLGALATYEDHPKLSDTIITRAIESVKLPLKQYEPDGGYPEGYGYWSYGTTYQVLLINALQTSLGTDLGLTKGKSFLTTAAFFEHLTAPSGKPFNFSDAGKSPEFNPVVFWFAVKLKDPSLLWVTKNQLAGNVSLNSRFLPAALVWSQAAPLQQVKAPTKNMWVGSGAVPLAMMRTSWLNPEAIFLAFKGGSPSQSHAHMDAGSFVMEANGVRWGIDLGMQEYESLESKGIDLWNFSQTSQRWQVLRYNNYHHNTLTLDGALQNVSGKAEILSHSAKPLFMNVVANLTSLYTDEIVSVNRGVAIANKSYVLVQDEVKTGEQPVTLRWSMVTPASVKILANGAAELSMNNKKLVLKVNAAVPFKIVTWSTQPTNGYDEPNPGTQVVGFEAQLPAKSVSTLAVYLIPDSFQGKEMETLPLAEWPKD